MSVMPNVFMPNVKMTQTHLKRPYASLFVFTITHSLFYFSFSNFSNLQASLPASGAPISRQRTSRVRDLYHEYVRHRTNDNWKFWVFGLLFEPLLNTFNQTVSVASLDEMCRTSQLWVDQHCSLVELRPAFSNKFRHLSTTTDILSEPPTTLREEALKAIAYSTSGNSNQNGVNFPRPSTSRFAGPSTSSFAGPSTSSYAGPSTSSFAGPSTSSYAGPSTSSFAGPSTSSFAGPSTSSFADPSSSGFPGPSTSGFQGPSSSGFQGPSSSGFPGPSSSGFPGSSSRSTPGPSSRSTPGPSSSFAGPSGSNTPYPSGSNTPGPSGSSTPGPSRSSAPGQSGSSTPGPSSGSNTNSPNPSFGGFM
ncbi:hypothetical protein RP20_CCG016448 [Aedes albopictus]|nr:hypothetical protein RP20_CCG016448 [Aedes albopictus]